MINVLLAVQVLTDSEPMQSRRGLSTMATATATATVIDIVIVIDTDNLPT